MSKAKLLLDVVSNIRSLADSLQAVANAMEETEPQTNTDMPAPAKIEKGKKSEVKLEDVRAILAVKSQAGMTAEVREIIAKYGGSKLSEIESVHYSDIIKDAEALANG